MDEYIFVCPRCGAVFSGPKESKKGCPDCRVRTVPTGISEKDWYSKTEAEREELRAGCCDDPAPEAAYEDYGPVSGRTGWSTLLRTVVVIELVMSCLGALMLGALLGGFAGFVAAVLLGGTAFVSVAFVMVFLDMASDIRTIRKRLDMMQEMPE